MGGIVELISNGLSAIAQFFGFQSKRLDLKNAPDVKQAAIAQDEVNAVDAEEKAVEQNNVEQIRKDLAE